MRYYSFEMICNPLEISASTARPIPLPMVPTTVLASGLTPAIAEMVSIPVPTALPISVPTSPKTSTVHLFNFNCG